MDVMQWGRMLWVRVQHHVKMVMAADVSSAVLITNDIKVLLFTVSTQCYTQTPNKGHKLPFP
jgi:hypothetical protein